MSKWLSRKYISIDYDSDYSSISHLLLTLYRLVSVAEQEAKLVPQDGVNLLKLVAL